MSKHRADGPGGGNGAAKRKNEEAGEADVGRKSGSSNGECTRGLLFLIGGGEDPDEDDMHLLPRFVGLCGGEKARLLVCGAPSESPGEKERTYRRLFEKIGVAEVVEAGVKAREDASQDDELLAVAERVTGVFFTGGDQLRLTSTVAGSKLDDVLRRRFAAGELTIGGTSAGAAAASSTMIIRGSDTGTVRRSDVDVAPGLGYWQNAVVDTHFSERGRVSRLLTLFAQNPHTLGVGLDSNTAVQVEPGKRFQVFGEGVVYVFDGRVTHSDAAEKSDDEVISITDSLVHVLTEGYGFDLEDKRPILPDGTKPQPRHD
jgi:cyanophycinase